VSLHAAAGFKVAADKGVWWLTAPGGEKMLSLGVDCVGPGAPVAEYDPAKPQYSPARRKGESEATWRQRTLGRLDAWGFNTLAGWSEASLSQTGKPFAPVLHIQASMGSIWWDLWGNDYEGQAKRLAEKTTAPFRGNPQLIGYFLDNELAWADDYLISIALTWPGSAPGKQHLVQTLKKTYAGDFKAFSADFTTRATDWKGLADLTDTARADGRGHRALDAWTYEVARRYYSVCSAAVRGVDPGKLILGDRFRQYYPQAVARAAKGVLDVISTNYEATTTDGWVSPAYFQTLHELSGLPVLVGEFYSAARQNRSGNKNHGGVFTLVDTQAQRARAVQAQAQAFAAFPFVVGWHWFQYNDEPTYGREDGEDYNMGLVDIDDQPYEEITGMFKDFNAAAPALHAAFKPAAPPRLPLEVPRREGLKADGKLDDWDKSGPGTVARGLIAAPKPLLPFGDFWLAWDESNLWIASRAYDFNPPTKHAPAADHEESWGELQRLAVTATGAAATSFYGATGYVEEEKPILFLRPPSTGHLQWAAGSGVDKWYAVWELAVPARELGYNKLHAGLKASVDLQLKNRGDFEEMTLKHVELILQ
jgi:hypothetical protein